MKTSNDERLLFTGGTLHIYKDENTGDFCVWLNGDEDFDGVLLATASTRDAAVRAAVTELEKAITILQEPFETRPASNQ